MEDSKQKKEEQRRANQSKGDKARTKRPPAAKKPQKPKGPKKENVFRAFTTPFKCQLPTAILGTTGIVCNSISLNPGDPTTDPRMAVMAGAWSKYRYVELKARWIPLGSAFASGNQSGQVIINFPSNWYSAASNSVTMATEKRPSQEYKAWESGPFCHAGAASKGWKSVRSGLASQGWDMRLTDVLMEVLVAGTPLSTACGFVEIGGTIEFGGDYVQNLTNAPRTNKLYAVPPATNTSLVTGVAQNLPFACLTGSLTNSGITGVVAAAATDLNTSFTLYGGTYEIECEVYCTGTSITAASMGITVTGYAQRVGETVANNGGGTFGVAAFTVRDKIVVTIPEDGTGTFTVPLTVTGTGTLVAVGGVLTVKPY